MSAFTSTILTLANGDGHMDWDGGWGVVMLIGMILFWALVILAIVWIVRELTGRHAHAPSRLGPEDPLAILDRRFAEGAISPDEYRERREILNRRNPSGEGSDRPI